MASSPDSDAPRLGPIAERVATRLDLAGRAFDRRHGASRPRKRRAASPDATISMDASDVALRRERACLRTVFLELGDAHRRYRSHTGLHGTPELRAAAQAFKDAPSTGSLLPVATFLDELQILTW